MIMIKKIIIVVIVAILIIFCVILRFSKDKKINNIDYFKKNKVASFNISDRYILENENEISIGKNKNELENGYYDIKISVDDCINIDINKLFKDFDNNVLYDELYVNEVIDYIDKSTNLNLNKYELKKEITSNYEIIRDIDRNDGNEINKEILNNNIKITVYEQNNILKLKLEV